MLRAWLIYGRKDAEKNRSFIKMHEEAGKKLDMEFRLLYAEWLSITVENSEYSIRYEGRTLEKPDFVLCRTRDYLLTRQFEKMGIPVFNNSQVSLAGNNKAIAYQEAAGLSIPVVDTCFCRQEYLSEVLSRALTDENGKLKEPMVVKSVSGHGGSQVFLYEDKKQLEEIVSGIGEDDAVIQPKVSGPGEDLRVYIIGNQIQGCVLRKASDGFRSNFSLGGSVTPYTLTEEERAVVDRILEHWQFDFAGIDFIRDEKGQLLFNEIEDVVGSRMYYQCYERDILYEYLLYINEKNLKEF